MMYVKPCIRDLVRIGGQQGRYGFLRLEMNENPGGLPWEFVEEVKQELTPEYLAMYPEESRVKELLAAYLEVTPENLCLTNGSDMGIRYLYETFAEPGSTVVTVAPSFEMYRIYADIFGLRHKPVPVGADFQIPAGAVLDAIDEDTDLVVLLNPNNPVGQPYTEEEFEVIADRADQVGALVIVDEAYHYFYKQTFLKQALKRDNVAVLRTFSKMMSLAGCRMGFVISNPSVIEYLRHVRPSFEVNAVALKFAQRLLERPELISRMIREADEGKEYLLRELRNRGYETMAQEGNFIFVKPKSADPLETAKRLEQEELVLVKTYGNPLLKDYLRISTGARTYMEQFLKAFDEVEKR